MANDIIMTGIPPKAKGIIEPVRKTVRLLGVDQYMPVGNHGYAKNLKVELSKEFPNREYIVWKDNGKSFIGRIA